jgi:hypothetical protein
MDSLHEARSRYEKRVRGSLGHAMNGLWMSIGICYGLRVYTYMHSSRVLATLTSSLAAALRRHAWLAKSHERRSTFISESRVRVRCRLSFLSEITSNGSAIGSRPARARRFAIAGWHGNLRPKDVVGTALREIWGRLLHVLRVANTCHERLIRLLLDGTGKVVFLTIQPSIWSR